MPNDQSLISETAEFKQRGRAIFAAEFEDFLPARILDFHVHIFHAATLPAGEANNCGGEKRTAYTFEDFSRHAAEHYPGRVVRAVCFGTPHVKYDFAANNAYLAGAADTERFHPLRLFDPTEADHEAVTSELRDGPFLGIKPYLNYVRKPDVNDVEIHEMLPAWIMEAIDDLGQIVMLHIPRKARLADPLNQRQLVELSQRYPNAKIVIAHVGRAYFMKNVVGHLDRLKDQSNLYFDLAMLNHWEVLAYLFERVPADRILYGTDLPIAAAPGKSVEINDQYTYVTPGKWDLSISDDHGKLVFTSFLYEELRAIKKAVEHCGLDASFVETIFHNAGSKLLSSTQ